MTILLFVNKLDGIFTKIDAEVKNKTNNNFKIFYTF